jgi:hypothetical protein
MCARGGFGLYRPRSPILTLLMKPFYYSLKWSRIPGAIALGLTLLSFPTQAQVTVKNSRPTIDPINDYTTSFSTAVRYIELTGITPGEEINQQVSIDVSTEDKDLLESVGADFVDNGKAFISYQIKEGAVGTATVKVVVTDDGPNPAAVTRTFHIIIEGLNRDIEPKPLLEETAGSNLKAIPNPASASARIFFSTPNDEERVAVELYSLSGAKVKQLFTGSTVANRSYYVDVNSKNFASGVYIVRLTGKAQTSNLKFVVAK